MPSGVEWFRIEDMNVFPMRGMAYGTVHLDLDEDIEGIGSVVHRLSIKVRVSLHQPSTIEGMQQALLDQAVAQLRRALDSLEGMSAQQLVSAAEEKADAERNKPFSLDLGK